jgi:hypothetical protein
MDALERLSQKLEHPRRRGALAAVIALILVANLTVVLLSRGGGARPGPEQATTELMTVGGEDPQPAEPAPLRQDEEEPDRSATEADAGAEAMLAAEAEAETEAAAEAMLAAEAEAEAAVPIEAEVEVAAEAEAEAEPGVEAEVEAAAEPPPEAEPVSQEPAATPGLPVVPGSPGGPGVEAGVPTPAGVAPLTGEFGDFGGRLGRPALMVKIDNVQEARPQAGLRDADIVIEEPVEGSVTRLAAIFHTRDARIGPIRSARTTDFELFPLLGQLLFSSSGANPSVKGQLQGLGHIAFDIGHPTEFAHLYERTGDRPMPHNLFTSTDLLYGAAPVQLPPPRPMFSYLADGEPLAGGATPSTGVALSFGGGEISRFNWNPGSGSWDRSQTGSAQTDVNNGAVVSPRNVVVLETSYDMSGAHGRSVPHGHSVGGGRAIVLTQGHAIVGRWERPGTASAFRLYDEAGQEIKLTPGQTFVELPVHGGAALL